MNVNPVTVQKAVFEHVPASKPWSIEMVIFVLSVQLETWTPGVPLQTVAPESVSPWFAAHPVGGVIVTCVLHVADPEGTVTMSPQCVATVRQACTSVEEADAAV